MKKKKPWKRILIAGSVLLVLLGGCLWYALWQSAQTSAQEAAFSVEMSPIQEDCLNVYMLDVGQGDSLLLVSPEGQTMLVDTGSPEQGETVLASLQALGVEELDILLLTHAHEDHAGAAAAIMKRIPVGTVCLTGDGEDYGDTLSKLLSRKRAEVLPLWAGADIGWSESCTVEVLSPLPDRFMGDENAGSAVVRVAYGESSILLCGDATVETENLLLALYPQEALESTVIKLAHHGSESSSSQDFLGLVSPELALVSVGAHNSYGHPSEEVLRNLKELKIPYVSTEEAGTVQIVLDGLGVQVIK